METASSARRKVSDSLLYCVGNAVRSQRGRTGKKNPDRTHWGPGICGGTSSPGVIYNRARDDAKSEVQSSLQCKARLNPTQVWNLFLTQLKLNLGDDPRGVLAPHRTCRY